MQTTTTKGLDCSKNKKYISTKNIKFKKRKVSQSTFKENIETQCS